MGEENKEKQKKEETKKEKKEEEKKEEETPEIVLKVDMHCEACARKIARALKGFEGVDHITADSKASKVVVKGKTADPIKVCERLQKKSGRKVELISPLPKPPPPDADDQEKKEQQKVEKKEEGFDPTVPQLDALCNLHLRGHGPPAAITVVLNVRMHCEACAQGLRKRIRKIQGVECVETNLASGQVIVKGVVDPVKLVNDVNKKTRKQASIVKDEEKKQEEKKEGEKKDGGEEAKVDEEKNKQQLDFNINRSEYWATKNYSEFAYAPQIFSDENPNACIVM
ncbi:hypothetical protein WN943_012846 [Citrus x changshan-huyou]